MDRKSIFQTIKRKVMVRVGRETPPPGRLSRSRSRDLDSPPRHRSRSRDRSPYRRHRSRSRDFDSSRRRHRSRSRDLDSPRHSRRRKSRDYSPDRSRSPRG